ncbi:hypothetical protein USDA257_c07450 [Sinorhizobium fredii USDA 257]|uniref:Uncharacterized protein n=1 Tax=Sinorhizobium fredii (strain USDA 257) TaxID=1185652 RepID=I3X0D2_SINF2|nr:hypothetical protein USDA257_c07450 [Sinorhizobium fredii USDA 257]
MTRQAERQLQFPVDFGSRAAGARYGMSRVATTDIHLPFSLYRLMILHDLPKSKVRSCLHQ